MRSEFWAGPPPRRLLKEPGLEAGAWWGLVGIRGQYLAGWPRASGDKPPVQNHGRLPSSRSANQSSPNSFIVSSVTF